MVSRPVGLTQDAGWQVGASRTVPHPRAHVWAVATSPAGIAAWLGAGAQLGPPGTAYAADDGTTGEVRSLRPDDRVRLTWRPRGRPEEATLQMALSDARGAGGGTVVRLHADRLASAEEREAVRARFHAALDALAELL